jgi:uncharacterized protein (TIGR02246 family)
MPGQRPSLVTTLLCVACACSSTGQPPEGRDADVQSAVLQTFDSLTHAIGSLNVEGMLSYYSRDSSIVRALDGRLISGRAAVERDFRQGFAGVRSMDRLDIVSRHVAVLGPQSAVLTVQLDEAFTDTTRHVTAVRATWTSVWQLQAGQWRIVQDAAVHTATTR